MPNINQEGVKEIITEDKDFFKVPQVELPTKEITFKDAVLASTATPGIFS